MSEPSGERLAVAENEIQHIRRTVDLLQEKLETHATTLNQFISCVKQERAERKGRDRALVVVGGAFGSGLTFVAANIKGVISALGVIMR